MSESETKATLDVIRSFNEAFNRHDVDGVMGLMTADCVFENTLPAPDGERLVGAVAGRGFWKRFFQSTPGARFEAEEIFGAGDRAVVRRVLHCDEGRARVRGVRSLGVPDRTAAER